MTVNNCQIYPFRFMTLELLFEPGMSLGVHREHDEPRRVAVDPVDDQRPPLATRMKMRQKLVGDRRIAAVSQRDRQQPGRLIDHDQRIVLVNDCQLPGPCRPWGAAARAAGPVHPHPDRIAGDEAYPGVRWSDFVLVDEYLSALQRGGRLSTRSEPGLPRKKLVEPQASRFEVGTVRQWVMCGVIHDTWVKYGDAPTRGPRKRESVMCGRRRLGDATLTEGGSMTSSVLGAISNELADAVAGVAPAVVQVQNGRRPVSGLVYADGVVLTTARALGRGDRLRVRRHDGHTFEAELAGWDPATGLAVLRVGGLGIAPVTVSEGTVRVGHIAVGVARSWSNAITASAGIVSVIGGPLRTGFRRAIDEVIRTTAPMHEGFAGGAFVDTGGKLIGVPTAAEIRGLAVVIPARIAWTTAAVLIEHGTVKRGYLGLAGQPVRLPDSQRGVDDRDHALLVVAVTPESPAEAAGVLVGDLLLDFDGRPIRSAEELLELLTAERIGHPVPVRVRRGAAPLDLAITVSERPGRL